MTEYWIIERERRIDLVDGESYTTAWEAVPGYGVHPSVASAQETIAVREKVYRALHREYQREAQKTFELSEKLVASVQERIDTLRIDTDQVYVSVMATNIQTPRPPQFERLRVSDPFKVQRPE